MRPPPNHFIWPAEYLGQQHWVETCETHFQQLPDATLPEITAVGSERVLKEGVRLLEEHRPPGKLNLTLTVLSVAPRVLEIQHFLSQTEIDHILGIAGATELGRSTVGNVEKDFQGAKRQEVRSDTRTSTNAWVPREKSPVIDAVYRRAADLLRMDEALLRDRGDDERPDFPSKVTIAEHLQLVHYDPGQEYVAHHGKWREGVV